VISFAAAERHLEIIKWAKSEGCEWGENAVTCAVVGGSLEIIIWLRENGCPWDENCILAAAYYGDLVILKWMKNNGFVFDERILEKVYKEAKQENHLKVMEWLHENGCKQN
jgi:hypothetical protein